MMSVNYIWILHNNNSKPKLQALYYVDLRENSGYGIPVELQG